MQQILSSYSASISELKKNPSALISDSNGLPIAVLNHNKSTTYLISTETYEKMLDKIDDLELLKTAKKNLWFKI